MSKQEPGFRQDAGEDPRGTRFVSLSEDIRARIRERLDRASYDALASSSVRWESEDDRHRLVIEVTQDPHELVRHVGVIQDALRASRGHAVTVELRTRGRELGIDEDWPPKRSV